LVLKVRGRGGFVEVWNGIGIHGGLICVMGNWLLIWLHGFSGQLQRWSGDDGAAAMDWVDCRGCDGEDDGSMKLYGDCSSFGFEFEVAGGEVQL
jgi:hypothetical protein